MKIQACLAFTALSIAITGAPAAAATFSFDVKGEQIQTTGNAGHIDAISTTFNDQTNQFTWSSTFSRNAALDTLAEGGWLVVNDGPNPSKDVREQVIFYMDGLNQKVSAYDYNGETGHQSWKTSKLLGTNELDVSTNGDESTLSFSWDMSSINAMTDDFGDSWKGAAFGEKLGVWFHGMDELQVGYADDGSLTEFNSTNTARSFYDRGDRPTVVSNDAKDVPEPGMAIALGVTAAAAAFTKRRKAYAAA